MKKNVFILLLFGVLLSCSDDSILDKPTEDPTEPGPVQNIQIQFEASEKVLSENKAAQTISIMLNKPAARNGNVIIQVASTQSDAFSIYPEMEAGAIGLAIPAGSTSVSFAVTPDNNYLLDGSKKIIFTLLSVTEGFSIGTGNQLNATITDDEGPVQINFTNGEASIEENNTNGSTIPITLSQAAPASGFAEISFSSENAIYGEHFTTVPQAVNGKISIAISSGAEQVNLKIIPVNNESITGARKIDFTLSAFTDAFQKGDNYNLAITITDDDLAGVSKGYTISAGSWGYKRYFSYRPDGKISSIFWEQRTPGLSSGTYAYEYNASGTLVKMTETPYTHTQYVTENERIIKTEKYTDGVLKQYTLYGYDDAGNIGEAAIYYRQQTGELKLGLLFVYLYYTNGNLYKQLTYTPVEGTEEHALISTRTYEHYLANENPFPIELLPNVNSQPNLPASYRVEENGHDIQYSFTYEFDNEGRVIKRIASSTKGSEIAIYNYY